jgi:hypothetical protein
MSLQHICLTKDTKTFRQAAPFQSFFSRVNHEVTRTNYPYQQTI